MNVAVIMCYSGRNFNWLSQSIQCLQSKHNLHIYLHLDGCSLPAEFKYDNVVVINSLKKIGLGAGLNKCIIEIYKANIRYDYIVRMDDDDLCSTERIDKQIDFLEKNNLIDFCSTLMSIVDSNGAVIVEHHNVQAKNNCDWVDRFLAGGCYIVHAACMFKSHMLYSGHLWYNPLYKEIEDYELWLRLFRLGYKYDVLSEYLYSYRMHPKQETQNNLNKKNKIEQATYVYFKENWKDFLC